MSQESTDKSKSAEARTQETESYVREVRRATRRKYTPEEKIRIVLEGFRREVTVRELCRREGIKTGAYYAWTKGLVDAIDANAVTLRLSLVLQARAATGKR